MYVKEELPVQAPLVVVSVWPSVVVPETVGTAVFWGVILLIVAVALLVPEALLAEFVAVTTALIVNPVSTSWRA